MSVPSVACEKICAMPSVVPVSATSRVWPFTIFSSELFTGTGATAAGGGGGGLTGGGETGGGETGGGDTAGGGLEGGPTDQPMSASPA